jgi:hypothetical protein
MITSGKSCRGLAALSGLEDAPVVCSGISPGHLNAMVQDVTVRCIKMGPTALEHSHCATHLGQPESLVFIQKQGVE